MMAWKIAAVLLVSAAMCGEARATGTDHAARAVPVALRETPRAPDGRVAACANMAALRALDAKAKGASSPEQDRLLHFAFVLCMSGAQIDG